ncbi:unnamed protein product, partial [Iphiclides podalirius]
MRSRTGCGGCAVVILDARNPPLIPAAALYWRRRLVRDRDGTTTRRRHGGNATATRRQRDDVRSRRRSGQHWRGRPPLGSPPSVGPLVLRGRSTGCSLAP